jgi:uncharacterized membrane protein YqaE (UPF0057 family)
VNVYLRLWLTCPLLSASCCCRLYWLQISGVSLTLTKPLRFCLLRVLLGTTATVTSFPLFQAHWGRWSSTCLFWLACVFTVHMGSDPSSLSCGVFLPPPLLQVFLLQGCWAGAANPAFSGQLVYLQFSEQLPLLPSSALWAPCPLCYVSFLLLLFIQFGFFLFFPWMGVSLSRGLCWSDPGLSVGVCVPLSSPGGLHLPK